MPVTCSYLYLLATTDLFSIIIVLSVRGLTYKIQPCPVLSFEAGFFYLIFWSWFIYLYSISLYHWKKIPLYGYTIVYLFTFSFWRTFVLSSVVGDCSVQTIQTLVCSFFHGWHLQVLHFLQRYLKCYHHISLSKCSLWTRRSKINMCFFMYSLTALGSQASLEILFHYWQELLYVLFTELISCLPS